jgi:hypothetical protein
MKIKQAALLGLLLLPTLAHADQETQVKLTQAKVLVAGKFTNAPSLKNILQEAVNCLAGPGGKGYDAGRPNPCNGVGNGVIPDAKLPADKARYEDALGKIQALMVEPDNIARARGIRVISALLAGEAAPDFNRAPAPPRPPTAAEIAAGVRAASEPTASKPATPDRNVGLGLPAAAAAAAAAN